VRRTIAAVAALAFLTAACGGGGDGGKGAASASASVALASASASRAQLATDEDAVLTMYADITQAFVHDPNAGVRALIAAQYPEDMADVSFARCVNALVPGAKTLPATKRVTFSPKITTMSLDPGYTVTSFRVKDLHPKGRIYVTDVLISDGGKPTVHQRHQVIVNGKAYQFSIC
jgi:hypothetical protein